MYVSTHLYNMYEVSPPSRPYCVSTIFHSSLVTKRKCNSHSSFFILHSSFYILHLTIASARFFTIHFSLFTFHFLLNNKTTIPTYPIRVHGAGRQS